MTPEVRQCRHDASRRSIPRHTSPSIGIGWGSGRPGPTLFFGLGTSKRVFKAFGPREVGLGEKIFI